MQKDFHHLKMLFLHPGPSPAHPSLPSPAPPQPQPPRHTCGQASASVSESARPCQGHTGLLPHPSFVFLICVKLKAGGSKLCGMRAQSSIWKATSHQARVPQELKRSAGVSLGVWLQGGLNFLFVSVLFKKCRSQVDTWLFSEGEVDCFWGFRKSQPEAPSSCHQHSATHQQ